MMLLSIIPRKCRETLNMPADNHPHGKTQIFQVGEWEMVEDFSISKNICTELTLCQ